MNLLCHKVRHRSATIFKKRLGRAKKSVDGVRIALLRVEEILGERLPESWTFQFAAAQRDHASEIVSIIPGIDFSFRITGVGGRSLP